MTIKIIYETEHIPSPSGVHFVSVQDYEGIDLMILIHELKSKRVHVAKEGEKSGLVKTRNFIIKPRTLFQVWALASENQNYKIIFEEK